MGAVGLDLLRHHHAPPQAVEQAGDQQHLAARAFHRHLIAGGDAEAGRIRGMDEQGRRPLALR